MKVSVIFGTRPEAIKLAPVILALKRDSRFVCRVCVTGQHRQMLDQTLEVFGITPDVDLQLMQANQGLGKLTGRAIEALDEYLRVDQPRLVLVQGDTTTVLCAGLASFYQRIPLGHIEAGLRTGNLQSPWPEEANRVLTSRLADLHFAPTDAARQNLLREGVAPERISVTGNTVIDSLIWVRDQLRSRGTVEPRFWEELGISPAFRNDYLNGAPEAHKLVLVTGHRRESFGPGFENICAALRELVESRQDVGVIYPVHLNPNVQQPVRRILGDHPRIQLIPPVGYEVFVRLMLAS